MPTICNNVSLVTRQPDDAPLGAADEPIDISPAAGPPPATPDVVVAQSPDAGLLDFIAPSGAPAVPDTSAGGGGGFPGSPIGGGGGGGGGIPTLPGGGGPCCDSGPIGPGGPGAPPPVVTPTSPVPEAPIWAMLLAGFASLLVRRSRRD